MTKSTYYDETYFNWQKGVGVFGGIANLFKFQEFVKETDTVVDFGCGGGYLLNNLKCANKLGIEINPAARAEAQGLGIAVFSRIEEIPNQAADVIVSNHALEHVLSPLEILKALQPKLKPGGKFVLVVPHHKPDENYNPNDINKHLFSWNQMTLGNLFACAGYQVLKAEAIQHKWPVNYLEIFSRYGEEEFHKRCRQYAVECNNYQIRIVATPSSGVEKNGVSKARVNEKLSPRTILIRDMIAKFNAEELPPKLVQFLKVYEQSLVPNNVNGLKSVGAFSLWYLLQALKPKYVIESGVCEGFSTWLIEKALPEVVLGCIDMTFDVLRYRSQKASYSTKDFLATDWSKLDKENSLIFFDDHQDALARTEAAKKWGFKYLIFDDNYAMNRGTHLSLSAAKDGYNNTLAQDGAVQNNTLFPDLKKRFDALNVKTYWVLPKLFKTEGDFFKNCGEDREEIVFKQSLTGLEQFYSEKESYRWLTFVEL
jgi:SAM-dependent methyltransferase